MADAAICVENLGKKYRLGQTLGRRRLGGMRVGEALANGLRSLLGSGPSQEEVWVLRDLNFEVQRGEAIGVIGRNGAGKSTLFKVLSRITSPTTGRIELNGRVASLLEVGTGFHPELTGRENIFMNGAILGMRRREIQERFDEIVAFSEVEKFIDTPVKRYSSGMYVRLAFAVAAHLDPEILLVDEVLAVGDAAFQERCLGKLADTTQGGRTVLFVSHNMAAVKRFCPRCVYLQDGRVAAIGRTDEIIGRYLGDSLSRPVAATTFVPKSALPLQARAVRVCDDLGTPRREFGLSSEIWIDVDYDVTRAVRQGTLIIAVAREGTYLFQSHDTDLDPDRYRLRPPGRYRARVPLPHRLLAPGTYTVDVATSVGPAGELGFDQQTQALSFVITPDEPAVFSVTHPAKRGHPILAELAWQTMRIEEPAAAEGLSTLTRTLS